MIIDRLEQQPNEDRLREILYEGFLSTGETLSSVSIATEKISGDADDSGNPFTATFNTIANGGLNISYSITGGADGNMYKATFSIDTSFTQHLEDEIIFTIREV